MTVDTAATSSPEPFPASPGSEARLTRLRDALKQLRAKSTSTVPLASIAPIADAAPIVPGDDLVPLNRTVPLANEAAGPAAPIEQADAPAVTLEVERSVTRPPSEPQLLPPPVENEAKPLAAIMAIDHRADLPFVTPPAKADNKSRPELSLESWFSPASLRQYRQLAGNMASQLPSGDPAAIGVAVLSCRHGAEELAARLAMCLAERREGDVLLVEPAGPRLALEGDVHSPGLIDVVAGRANWADAIVSTEMKGLSLLGFGSTAAAEDAPLNDQWRTALVDLKRRFHYVVSAARPAESFPSDALLGAIDGVYLAVSLGEAPRKLVAACHSQLKSLGARLLGCIAIQ